MSIAGWGGSSPKLHWLVPSFDASGLPSGQASKALCGTRVKSNEIERDATEKYVIDFGCWTCKARLARRPALAGGER